MNLYKGLHLVGGELPGVGKSVVAKALVDFCRSQQWQTVAVEADLYGQDIKFCDNAIALPWNFTQRVCLAKGRHYLSRS